MNLRDIGSNDYQAVNALWESVWWPTRGAAKLRLGMLSPRLYNQLGPHAATARSEGGWQHAHVRIAPDAPDLTGWAPTPFDGDLFMSLRPPPVRPSQALRAA